nr:EOG090X076T [Triops cancriformis]
MCGIPTIRRNNKVEDYHSSLLGTSAINDFNLPKEAELKKTEHPTYPEIGRIIDRATIQHLERLSLVDFANIQGIARLEEAIRFADQIRSVDTTGVEPLISVLEDYDLALREDSVTEGGVAELVLSNASITEDDYFVAPPGNSSAFLQQHGQSLVWTFLGHNFKKNLLAQWNTSSALEENNFCARILEISRSVSSQLRLPLAAYSIKEDQLFFSTSPIPHPDHVTWLNLGFWSPKGQPQAHQLLERWRRQRTSFWKRVIPFISITQQYRLNSLALVFVNVHKKLLLVLKTNYFVVATHDRIVFSILFFSVLCVSVSIKYLIMSLTFGKSCLLRKAISNIRSEALVHRRLTDFLHTLAPSLAPLQVGIALNDQECELARFIYLQLQEKCLRTFLVDSDAKTDQCDIWGVPYIVRLKPTTPQNGILGLRNRDTTLEEKVHLAHLPDHVTKLLV